MVVYLDEAQARVGNLPCPYEIVQQNGEAITHELWEQCERRADNGERIVWARDKGTAYKPVRCLYKNLCHRTTPLCKPPKPPADPNKKTRRSFGPPRPPSYQSPKLDDYDDTVAALDNVDHALVTPRDVFDAMKGSILRRVVEVKRKDIPGAKPRHARVGNVLSGHSRGATAEERSAAGVAGSQEALCSGRELLKREQIVSPGVLANLLGFTSVMAMPNQWAMDYGVTVQQPQQQQQQPQAQQQQMHLPQQQQQQSPPPPPQPQPQMHPPPPQGPRKHRQSMTAPMLGVQSTMVSPKMREAGEVRWTTTKTGAVVGKVFSANGALLCIGISREVTTKAQWHLIAESESLEEAHANGVEFIIWASPADLSPALIEELLEQGEDLLTVFIDPAVEPANRTSAILAPCVYRLGNPTQRAAAAAALAAAPSRFAAFAGDPTQNGGYCQTPEFRELEARTPYLVRGQHMVEQAMAYNADYHNIRWWSFADASLCPPLWQDVPHLASEARFYMLMLFSVGPEALVRLGEGAFGDMVLYGACFDAKGMGVTVLESPGRFRGRLNDTGGIYRSTDVHGVAAVQSSSVHQPTPLAVGEFFRFTAMPAYVPGTGERALRSAGDTEFKGRFDVDTGRPLGDHVLPDRRLPAQKDYVCTVILNNQPSEYEWEQTKAALAAACGLIRSAEASSLQHTAKDAAHRTKKRGKAREASKRKKKGAREEGKRKKRKVGEGGE